MKAIVFLWHGHTCDAHAVWFDSVANDLREAGFTVIVPSLPHKDTPVYDEWKAAILETIRSNWNPEQPIFMICYSLGAYTLNRMIMEDKNADWVKATKCIMAVSPVGAYYDEPRCPEYTRLPIDYSLIATLPIKIIHFHCPNDPILTPDHSATMREGLKDMKDYEYIERESDGHYEKKQYPILSENAIKLANIASVNNK